MLSRTPSPSTPKINKNLLLINPSADPHVSLSQTQTHASNLSLLPSSSSLIFSNLSLSSSPFLSNQFSQLNHSSNHSYSDNPNLNSNPNLNLNLLHEEPLDPLMPLSSSSSNSLFALPSSQRPSPALASFPPSSSASKPTHSLSCLSHHIIDLSPTTLPPRPQLPPSPPPLTRRTSSLHWHNLALNRPLLAFCIQLAALLCLSAALVAALVWALLPPIAPADLQSLRIPTSFEALKKLNALLQVYKTQNYYRVMGSFVVIYLFLQAFSLPGSMYLSILAGAMFGLPVGLPLVCVCVATGAISCYSISARLAGPLLLHSTSLRTRLDLWRLQLATRTDPPALFAYLVVVRISPLPPHWAVNLLAPHVGIPPTIFWLSTCLGILPASLIHTQLGTTLDQMAGPDELVLLTPRNLAGLALVAAAVLVPVAIRWYVQQRPSEPPRLPVSSERGSRGAARLCNLAQGHAYQPVPVSASSASLAELCRRTSTDTLIDDSPRRAIVVQDPIVRRVDGSASGTVGGEQKKKIASGSVTSKLVKMAKEETSGCCGMDERVDQVGLSGQRRQKSRQSGRNVGQEKNGQTRGTLSENGSGGSSGKLDG